MTMSDKIAVMNEGKFEQVGSPSEVYREPDNLFVAQFIGSPEINLLDATLVDIDGSEAVVELRDGTRISFEVGEYLEERASEDVTVGFRPRKTTVEAGSGASGIKTTVELHEPLGDEVLMYLDAPEGELRTVVPINDEVPEGDVASIKPTVEGLYLFNRETGERFARGRLDSDEVADVAVPTAASD